VSLTFCTYRNRGPLSGISFLKTRILLVCLMLLAIGAAHAQDEATVETSAFKIEPMTKVDVAEHLGYFGDPYPIHTAPWLEPYPSQYFSGTTPELLQCGGGVRAGCFTATPLQLTVSDSLQSDVQAAGNVFGDVINRNVYQTIDGAWQMAVTLYVHPKGDSAKTWTVIAHAHTDESSTLVPPTSWIADKILVGSLSTFAYANYDGEYFEDDGLLYLIYSKRLITSPVEHDGIVAQKMQSSKELASEGPVVLLAPSTGSASLNSEYFHTAPPAGDTFKLIETGNLIKIAGKYVMAYSAGDYQQLDYKTGVAYSDTLLPKKGEMYRKIVEEDRAGVWGQPGHLEVRYLLLHHPGLEPFLDQAKDASVGDAMLDELDHHALSRLSKKPWMSASST
jgi:hypothetical protein